MKKALFALLLLSSVTAAQDVHINGIVEPAGPGTVTCPYAFQIQDAGVFLDPASAVSLSGLAGQVVRLSGPLLLDPVCPQPVMLVTSVTPATATLDACGTPRPGCTIRFKIGPPTVSLNYLAASVGGPDFLDLGDPLGVLFLQPPPILLGQAGVGGTLDVPIPPVGLVGITVTVQGLHVEVGPVTGQAALTNPLGIEFFFGPACIDHTSCGF